MKLNSRTLRLFNVGRRASEYMANMLQMRYQILLACAVLLSPFSLVQAISTEVLYQSDFTSDPAWITDQPSNFYWDEATQALFARTYNRPDPNYSPSRHYYTETTLNPELSYELTWDMQILNVEGGGTSGVAVFGLYGDRLYGFNPLNLNFAGNSQDGTFSLRLMTLEGQSQFIFTEVNPGYNYDIGESTTHSFSLGAWYSVTERYTAQTREYAFELRERDTGTLLYTHSIIASPDEPVNPALQNLGISMHPEGTGATNLSVNTRIDGFTEYLIDNVVLTQVYDETYTEPSSVLFLPGIQASRLYTDGLLGSEDQLWEPNINGDVAELAMTNTGESVESVYTRDIIDSIFGITDVYGSFENYLDTLVSSGVISDWEAFAYDWRYSVSDVVEHGTQYADEERNLVDLVQTLALTNNSKVTIVAHSNGGLLAKALVKKLEAEGLDYLVDRIIFVATPQQGTPKAIGAVLHGYDQEKLGGLVIDDVTARDVMRNFPGVYGLVPSEAFFTSISTPLIRFAPGTTTQPFISAYGPTIDTSNELVEFMVGNTDGRSEALTANQAGKGNETMLNSAYALHRDTLDGWIAPSHIQVVEIVGVGLDTVKGFEYTEFLQRTCIPTGGEGGTVVCTETPYYEPVPMLTQYGDQTVVSDSAEAYTENKQTYYVDLDEVDVSDQVEPVKHADITALHSLQQFIGGLLQNSSVLTPFIYGTKPVFNNSREVISVHSPVTLSLTDSAGNLVGREGSGTAEHVVTNVPGSSYFQIGGATYIVVPTTVDYTVHIEGTASGSYTLVRKQVNGETAPVLLSELKGATTTPNMIAEFTKVGGVYSDVTADYNGDGTVDEVVTLDGEPTTAVLYTWLRDTMQNLALLKVSERNWLVSAVTKAEQAGLRKGNNSDAVARSFGQIDGRLVQYVAGGKVSSVQYTYMKNLMQEIMSRP